MYLLYNHILLGSIHTWTLMTIPLLTNKDLTWSFSNSTPLYDLTHLTWVLNWVWKDCKNSSSSTTTYDLVLIRKIQTNLENSSTKVKKIPFYIMSRYLIRAQISAWIRSNTHEETVELVGKGNLDCLATGHIIHTWSLNWTFRKPFILFNTFTGACPNILCHKVPLLVIWLFATLVIAWTWLELNCCCDNLNCLMLLALFFWT